MNEDLDINDVENIQKMQDSSSYKVSEFGSIAEMSPNDFYNTYLLDEDNSSFGYVIYLSFSELNLLASPENLSWIELMSAERPSEGVDPIQDEEGNITNYPEINKSMYLSIFGVPLKVGPQNLVVGKL